MSNPTPGKIKPPPPSPRRAAAAEGPDCDELQAIVGMMRDLFDQAPGAMLVFVGPDHVVRMANPAYYAFTGLTPEIIGKPARIGLKRGYANGFGRLLDEVYSSGQPKAVRNAKLTVNRTPGGPDEEAYGDFVLQPLRAGDGRVVGVFCQGHEVTREKLASDALKASEAALQRALEESRAAMREHLAAEEKLRQAQKMEAIGRLTGGIAHDFNNLLTVVIGSAEQLAESLSERSDLAELAGVALGAAERGAELVSRLLAFARTQPLAPRAIDCAAFLDGLRPMLARAIGRHIEVVVEPGPPGLACLADRTQLTSAMLNLAINARDAMPDGGRLTLRAQRATTVAGDTCAVLSVEDTGEGMSEATRARALEPFFTTKPEGQGSGLGLAMVHGFTTQSDGRLDIDSEVGRGTAIRMWLPAAAAPCATADAAGPQPRPLARHVLLVEDDDLLREQAQRQLTALGCRVTARRNGHDALRALAEASDIELMMTDIVMPGGMNGRQLADHARLLYPQLRVLFTSGHTDEVNIRALPLDARAAFLPKPYRRGDLARALAQICGEVPADAAIGDAPYPSPCATAVTMAANS